MKKSHIAVVMAVTFVLCSGMTAFGITMKDDNPQLRKLGRGLANVGFGVLEVPASMYAIKKQEGDIAGATYGTIRGLWRFGVREVVGVFEVLTAPVPTGPIVLPEFLAQEGVVPALVDEESNYGQSINTKWDVAWPENREKLPGLKTEK